MSTEHIGKQPDHQSNRFGKHTENLDDRHHRNRTFQPGRQEKAINQHPIYGKLRKYREKKQDFLFSDREMDQEETIDLDELEDMFPDDFCGV